MPGLVLGVWFQKLMVRASVALLACVGWSATAGTATAQDARAYLDAVTVPRSGLPCPPVETFSPLRPDPAGVPTVVAVGMLFVDIVRFVDATQSLTADVYVLVRWRDPRLADPRRGDSAADCPIPGEQLWMPVVEPDNLRSIDRFYEGRFLVDAEGTVTLARRVLAEVSNVLDLHDFPFDRHQFRLTLWPTISQSDEVQFHTVDRFVVMSPEESLQGWSLEPPVASVRDAERTGRLGRFSRFDVTIAMSRNWLYYALKLGVPLLLIVVMAYSIYYLPPSSVGQQIGVGMTSILTLVAYMLALGSSLPPISYLTRADRLFVGCALLVFLGLIKAIVTAMWLEQGATRRIAAMDHAGRWAYPAAFVLVLIVALVL